MVNFGDFSGCAKQESYQYSLIDFAELYVTLSPAMAVLLQRNNPEQDGIKFIDDNNVLLVRSDAKLRFRPIENKKELYFIGAEVHFISDKLPELNEFEFDMNFSKDGKDVNTMRLTAVRDESVYFKAHAEASKTKVVRAKEEVTLTSNQIIDDAQYIWYNESGAKIGTGYQITIMPTVSQKYKIVIMKEYDGYKSYDEVEVIVVDGAIRKLSPNPAHNNVTVEYKLSDNATSAFIQISDMQNLVSTMHPISITDTLQNIYIAGLVPGSYLVKLIIGGATVDTKPLIIY
jgi:hypothetical protein